MATIYTVGHGLLALDELVDNLVLHDIAAVVDVRSQPFSGRAPQFNKEALASALKAKGIDYAWMGQALGGRPPDHLRTSSGAPDYERMVCEAATVAALDKLAAASERGRIVLLCSESHPESCHRSRMLEPELERRGAAVEHILRDGTLASQPSLFV